MKALLLSLAVFLVDANPPPQSQSCSDYQWFNPRTNACQSYVLATSCGLLGKTCGSGEYCTNNDGWSRNAMGTRPFAFLFLICRLGLLPSRTSLQHQWDLCRLHGYCRWLRLGYLCTTCPRLINLRLGLFGRCRLFR